MTDDKKPAGNVAESINLIQLMRSSTDLARKMFDHLRETREKAEREAVERINEADLEVKITDALNNYVKEETGNLLGGFEWDLHQLREKHYTTFYYFSNKLGQISTDEQKIMETFLKSSTLTITPVSSQSPRRQNP